MAKSTKTTEVAEDVVITDETNPVSVPDVPAQMEEVAEPIESDEILFLRKLMDIQDNGGWGRHLHGVINDRIKQLKSE